MRQYQDAEGKTRSTLEIVERRSPVLVSVLATLSPNSVPRQL